MRISRKNKWIALALALVVAGAVWAMFGGSAGGGGGKSFVRGKRMGKVKRGDLVQRVTVSGLTIPQRKTVIVPPYDGYVRKLYVKIGEKVKAGAPLVAITSSLASPEQVYPIRAPFSGTVVDVERTEGEYVATSDQKKMIIRLDDLDKIYILAKAAEIDASRIQKGMEVDIRMNAFKHGPLKGVVRDIDLAAEEADGWRNQSSTFGVKVEVLDPPAEMRSGQSAIIDIVTGKFADVLFLEHEFVNREGDKYFVITKNGQRKNIEVGRQSDLAVEITSGLAEGEEIEQVDFLKLLEGGA